MNDGIEKKYQALKALMLDCNSIDSLLGITADLLINTYEDIEKNTCFKHNQALALIGAIKNYFKKNSIAETSTFMCRVYVSRYDELVCFFWNSSIKSFDQLKNIHIVGLYRGLNTAINEESDNFSMEIGVKIGCGNTPIEIKTINSGRYKRHGIGTLGLRFLEEAIVPSINDILVKLGNRENVGYIYGISADLSEETSALARAKFYSRNGYQMINSHFYKYLR